MNPLDTKNDYQNYVDKKSPNSPIIKNCFNAFWVGGLICSFGQLINEFCKNNDVVIIFNLYDEETAEIYKKYL